MKKVSRSRVLEFVRDLGLDPNLVVSLHLDAQEVTITNRTLRYDDEEVQQVEVFEVVNE